MQLFPSIPEEVFWEVKPDLQDWELFEQPRGDVPHFLLIPDALFQKSIDLLLVILDVVDGEDLAFGVPAEEPQVLVSLVHEMLVDFGHDDGALALVGELDVALDLLDDLHHIDLLSRDNVADVGVDDRIFFEYLHVLEVDRLLLLVAGVLVQVLEAEVLAVVSDVVVLADDHPLAGLELGNADFIVVEHALLVFLQLI